MSDAAPVKRRRGRPKGSAKVPGSGRKPKDWKTTAKDEIYQFVVKGLSGQPVMSGGSTGKPVTAPLTQDNQVKLLQTAWRKLEPDLSASAIKADVEQTTYAPEVPPREAARAIANMFSQNGLKVVDESEARMIEHKKMYDVTPDPMKNAEAVHSYQKQVADIRLNKAMEKATMAEPSDAESSNDSATAALVSESPEGVAEPLRDTRILERSQVVSPAGQDGGSDAQRSGDPLCLTLGQKVKVGNGYIQADHRVEGKLWPLDSDGQRHGAHRTWESAKAHIENIAYRPKSTEEYMKGADTIDDQSRRDNQPSIGRTRSRAQRSRSR